MTVIAWDGKTLAADKRGNAGGSVYTVRKIHRAGDCLVGFTGAGDRVGSLLKWLEGGRVVADYPPNPCDDSCWMLVINPDGKIERFEDTPWPQVIEEEHYAVGAGQDFARAAMHLGFDARKAVEVASVYESSCGNGIDVLELESP